MAGGILLYIDPGTGGMLFTILIGLMGGIFYFFSSLAVKLKYSVGGRGKEKANAGKLPLVIFTDHKRYWNIYEPILGELERRGVSATYLTMSEDDPIFEQNYKYIKGEYIGNGNKAFSRLGFLNARIVFSSTPGLDVLQWKRSKNVDYYVHIPHACSDITIYRMFGIDYFDAILLSGDYQTEEIRELERMRNLPAKEIVKVGVPYMDTMRERLIQSTFPGGSADTITATGERTKTATEEGTTSATEEGTKTATEVGTITENGSTDTDESVKITEKRRTVLVAPSWGESGLLALYGERLLDELLKTGYRIIVRPHPQSFTADKELLDRLMKKYEGTGLEWNRDNDNFEVLKDADLMVSDFSGVIFDFALVFDKPFLYAESKMDKSPYDCAWIEKELWVYDVLPKIGVQLKDEDFPNIKNVIDECIDNPKGKENRDRARSETWAYIGKGKEKVADYLIGKLKELNDREIAQ